MLRAERSGGQPVLRAARAVIAGLVAVGAYGSVAVMGCGSDDAIAAGSGGNGGAGGSAGTMVAGLDVLLVVDNSRLMTDKALLLAEAVPKLLADLADPPCLDAAGKTREPAAGGACPDGSARPFEPLTDIHVAVISSSLGGHGADACAAVDVAMENDRGRLLDRSDDGGFVATYSERGYLAWDPRQRLDPAGEADAAELGARVSELVLGAGQLGCGYEATHEAWYRFLVEPDPHEEVVVEDLTASLVGTDEVVLWQRAAFLRPDTALAIVVLSDENDCSMREGGQMYLAAQLKNPVGDGPYHLPRARAACESDPSDPCCRSCAQAPGEGCDSSDDLCGLGTLDDLMDHANLRCFDQKRRFGIDFLQPVGRYVDALQKSEVSDRDGNVVSNPLFSDLDPGDERPATRGPGDVVLMTIVGVPWQDIARRDASGDPSLLAGTDPSGHAVGGFQSADQLVALGTWQLILGDPSRYYADPGAWPEDPLMRSSVEPRQGAQPVTGEPLAPPDAEVGANRINSHEYDIPLRDDLQYACVFDLPQPHDCDQEAVCACPEADTSSPLCQDAAGGYGTTQYRAGAYPGIRHLQIVQALGAQGALGSICAPQTDDPTGADYGYDASMRALLEALAPTLSP